jgi:hypothetical protein
MSERQCQSLSLTLRKSDVGAKSFHCGGDSSLGDTSNGFDHEAYIERDNAVCANPARRRKRPRHKIGRRQRQAMFLLRTRGNWECDEVAVTVGCGERKHRTALGGR